MKDMEKKTASDFSNAIRKFQEQTDQMSKMLQNLIQPIIDTMNRWKEILAPIIEVNRQFEQMLPKITIPDSFRAVLKLGDAQYVYWEYLSEAFKKDVIGAADTDQMLLEFESRNDYSASETLISECEQHKFVIPYKTLYDECIRSYHSGAYHLSAVGLTSVIDAVLAEASNNPTHKALERCNAIVKKLEEKEDIDEKEYAVLALEITFSATVEFFYKPAPFTEAEPNGLNRNWIAHGRSTRDYTRLDCLKLIRLLYGIIVFDELENSDN